MTRVPFALAFALLLGCNTAQVTEPPEVEGGSLLCVTDVSTLLCDAGGVTVGCAADPDSGFAAARGVPEGDTVPYGCQVRRSEVTGTPVECRIYSECRCQAPDGGGEGGAGAPGAAGTWSCSTAR